MAEASAVAAAEPLPDGDEAYQAWLREWRQIEAQAGVLGLERVEVEGDGACLFRALQVGLGQAESFEAAFELRQRVVEYMRGQRERFAPFVVGGYWRYLKAMAEPDCWADACALEAAAELLGVRAKVVKHNLVATVGGRGPVAWLCLQGEGHYDALRRTSAVTPGRPPKKQLRFG